MSDLVSDLVSDMVSAVLAAAGPDPEGRPSTYRLLIADAATTIAEDLERGQRHQRLRRSGSPSERRQHREIARSSAEETVLVEFDRMQAVAIHRFADGAGGVRLGTVVLREFYNRGHDNEHEHEHEFEQPYAALIAAMLAATSEAHGRPWLYHTEAAAIAASLERTGKELMEAGFPRFAERAFGEAAHLHSRFDDAHDEHRCRYSRLGARRTTYPWWRPPRFFWGLSRAVFGYGYRPLRLLAWIAAVVALFALYLLHLPRDPGATRGDALFVALQNFVSPLGLNDVKDVSPKWETPLVFETYTGDLLRAAFLVVVIRRWSGRWR